ncbi:MAG TPA: hypothetical protein VIL16_03310 [Trebonia sp.]
MASRLAGDAVRSPSVVPRTSRSLISARMARRPPARNSRTSWFSTAPVGAARMSMQ